MSNFLTLDYWFNMRAGALHGNIQNMFIAFIVILAISVIFSSYYKKLKGKGFYYKLINNLQLFSIINLIIALFLLFFYISRNFIFIFPFLVFNLACRNAFLGIQDI